MGVGLAIFKGPVISFVVSWASALAAWSEEMKEIFACRFGKNIFSPSLIFFK